MNWNKLKKAELIAVIKEAEKSLGEDDGVATEELLQDIAEYLGFAPYTGDPHLGCPSYPNCDEGPMGCGVMMGSDVEWYGHRD